MKTEYVKCCGRMLLVLLLCTVLMVGTAWADEQEGTLLISLKTDAGVPQETITVKILRVADDSGRLTDTFEETELTSAQLTMERYSRSSAETLLKYADGAQTKEMSLQTENDGRAHFDGLEKGVYVVYCEAGQSVTFEPFLVSLPDASGTWKNSADPKTEDKPENPEGEDSEDKDSEDEDSEDEDSKDGDADPEGEGSESGKKEDDTDADDPDVPGASGENIGADGDIDANRGGIPQTGFNYWVVWILLGIGIILSLSGILCLRSERNGGRE